MAGFCFALTPREVKVLKPEINSFGSGKESSLSEQFDMLTFDELECLESRKLWSIIRCVTVI